MPPRPIYALVWTPGKAEIVSTKKEARERMQAWRSDYEGRGWLVRGSCGGDALIATAEDGEQHAIVLHSYDPVTKQRIEKPLPSAETDEELRARLFGPKPEKQAPKRRGRRPVAA